MLKSQLLSALQKDILPQDFRRVLRKMAVESAFQVAPHAGNSTNYKSVFASPDRRRFASFDRESEGRDTTMLPKPLAAFPLSLLFLFGLALPAFDDAKARSQSKGLDLTIKSCADFRVAESHLEAAYHVITKGYDSNPTQKEPVAKLEGVETPEKMQEFMSWYANGGHDEMFITGQMCQTEIRTKSGNAEATEVGYLIVSEELRNSEFFANKLMK